MLRAVKHAFNAPRLIGVKATSAAAACTVNIGAEDVYSAASSADGRAYLTLKDPFTRAGIICGTPFSPGVGASGAVLIEAVPTAIIASMRTHDGSAGDDGALNAFILGYDSSETGAISADNGLYEVRGTRAVPFSVKSTFNAPRVELFKINANASPTILIGSAKATIARTGAGAYTITFKRPFASDDVIAAIGVLSATAAHAHVVACSATAVSVVVGASGSGSDANDFYLVVKGSDCPTAVGNHRKVLRASDRLPRLIAGHITITGGVPAVTTGTGDFTVTDTGTGQITIGPVREFAREPMILVNKDTAGLATIEPGAGRDGWILNTFNAAGAAADAGAVYFMAWGYDDDNEYAI